MRESVSEIYRNIFLMLATEKLASQAHYIFAIDDQAACEKRKLSMTSSPDNLSHHSVSVSPHAARTLDNSEGCAVLWQS